MNLLTVSHLKKAYGTKEVLKDISFSLEKGEVLSIIGPSGSGKSTCLRCCTGLDTCYEGTISYEGTYGLVFQNFNLFPHMSVLQNITDAPIHVQKRNKEEVRQTALGLLKKVGLEDKVGQYPYQLSGGEKQRVAIARALCMKPDILFFDEPTSALDPELTAGILKIIRGLAEEKMTMVIVTHEMNFARSVSDKVLFMEKGLVVAQGTPKEVFDSDIPRLKEFLGSLEG